MALPTYFSNARDSGEILIFNQYCRFHTSARAGCTSPAGTCPRLEEYTSQIRGTSSTTRCQDVIVYMATLHLHRKRMQDTKASAWPATTAKPGVKIRRNAWSCVASFLFLSSILYSHLASTCDLVLSLISTSILIPCVNKIDPPPFSS